MDDARRFFGDSARAHETVAGTVERVTFHSEDTGFAVLRVSVRGRRNLVTVVGHAASITPGEFIQARGNWVHDRTHGLQFNAATLTIEAPTSAAGIEKYLGSGLIRGIGPHFARRLVATFGTEVFDVIEQHPERLQEVPGIGPVRAARIAESWQGQRAVRDIMVFLHAHGVGTSRAVRIYKTYGTDAIAIISENPYRLAADIHGIGFLTADRIAERLGVPKTALVRARAGIGFALLEAMDDGHCGLPVSRLKQAASALLQVPDSLIDEALNLELAEGTVVADTWAGEPCVFLSGLAAAERNIAARLKRLAQGTPPWPAIDAAKALPWVERRLGLTLANLQAEAVRLALTSKLLVITGGPGVGKTTLLNAILAVLTVKRVRPALCAPTGRAAKRLAETTGLPAKTIHRLLEVDPRTGGFRRDERHPLDADLVVADEMSMVDVPLMHALVRAVPPSAALILVGDVDQLPSVGPGQVLGDIISARIAPVVRLTEVFRQAAASRIIVNAHRINRGEMPECVPIYETGAADFLFADAQEPEVARQRLLEIVTEQIPRRFGLDPVRDIQVLCPMNRGVLGARSLNLDLQKLLNPAGEPRIERFGWMFAVGDKVMQIENDYDKDVYNGDIGRVAGIDAEAGELTIEFDGRPVTYEFGELDRVVLAYATTVHKAQGSEYPAVVMPISTQHYPMLQRNLLYTGVTRGRRLVVLVGQIKALAIAVRQGERRMRVSRLREWLEAR